MVRKPNSYLYEKLRPEAYRAVSVIPLTQHLCMTRVKEKRNNVATAVITSSYNQFASQTACSVLC